MENKVKWFNNEKGYGFIEYKGNDILIHYCAFREQEKEETIEFELTEDNKKS